MPGHHRTTRRRRLPRPPGRGGGTPAALALAAAAWTAAWAWCGLRLALLAPALAGLRGPGVPEAPASPVPAPWEAAAALARLLGTGW
jgi:hypothetical protein